jgi:protein-S-isoprenylcysteine O-methyltransferase Ste14
MYDKGKKQGKVYTEWVPLVLSINYGLLMLSAILEYIIFRRQINPVISGIALSVMVIRFLIKHWAFRSLDGYYSSSIEIRETHKLIKTGPYKYVRHPAYLSNLLDYIAVPLLLNSFYTILLFFPLQIFLIHMGIHFEEKVLIKKFGEEYIRYKRETGGLAPLVPFMKEKIIKS